MRQGMWSKVRVTLSAIRNVGQVRVSLCLTSDTETTGVDSSANRNVEQSESNLECDKECGTDESNCCGNKKSAERVNMMEDRPLQESHHNFSWSRM